MTIKLINRNKREREREKKNSQWLIQKGFSYKKNETFHRQITKILKTKIESKKNQLSYILY
jgi:hypothetical protein